MAPPQPAPNVAKTFLPVPSATSMASASASASASARANSRSASFAVAATESPDTRKRRLRSLNIVHLAIFVYTLGFSIILTGVFPYMQMILPSTPAEHLLLKTGWVVAVNPLGQMLFSPVLGWIEAKLGYFRLMCLMTSLAYTAGNLLYAVIAVAPEDARFELMLLSRFLVGVSSAVVAIMRSYVSSATYTHERTKHMSRLSLFQSLGIVIGPALQAVLTAVPGWRTELGQDAQGVQKYLAFDMFTLAGWIGVPLGVLTLILFLPGIFTEFNVAGDEKKHIAALSGTGRNLRKPDYLAAMACMVSFLIFQMNFVVLQSLGTPVAMDQYGWTKSETMIYLGILLFVGGFLVIFVFGTVTPLSERIDERKLLLFGGIIPMLLQRLVQCPIPGLPPPKTMEDYEKSSFCNDTLLPDVDAAANNVSFPLSAANQTLYLDCRQKELEDTSLCIYDWCSSIPALSVYQFVFGSIFGFIAFPFCVALTQSLLSQVLGPRPQGLWMGALTAAGSLARVLGPVLVNYIYQEAGLYITTLFLCLTVALSLILCVLMYNRLVPLEVDVCAAGEEGEVLFQNGGQAPAPAPDEIKVAKRTEL